MEISDLYILSLTDDNNHQVVEIGLIDLELAEKIFQYTGIDLEGYAITIDNYGLKHTLKRHGDSDKEALHGQVEVKLEDFELIPLILREADNIHLSARQKSKNSPFTETLIFEKEVQNYYYVLKEIKRVTKKGKVRRLVFQTMYITKKRRTF
ncbi:hypothetical protein [Haliscomenobacter sp.]|uniref:PBECR3 domain-containing polyvalent protein n=1 Tax=Haliscomenobacter sp. TaxID=2717303 RepID=UPI003593EB36